MTTAVGAPAPPPPPLYVLALEELLREAVEVAHQTGSIRDHHDPAAPGWEVHGIETCRDGLCVEVLALLAAGPRR